MSKICPKGCNALLFDVFEFCYECGAKLEVSEDQICVCGNMLIKVAKFCPFCGRPCEEATKKVNQV